MRRTLGGMLAAVFITVGVGTATAQDHSLVLIHGFNSNGDSWQAAADRLQSRVAVVAARRSTDWKARYEAQAEEIHQTFGALTSPIAIGHSNGGIIARQWSRMKPLDGIITIGTPHQGAPIFQNAALYANYDLVLADAISDVFDAFSWHSAGWEWVIDEIIDSVELAAALGGTSFVHAAVAVGLNIAAPIVVQMIPGSSYLTELNSGWNLARESTDVASRVGIVSIAHHYYWGGPIRAAAPEHGDRNATIRDAGAIALAWGALQIDLRASPTNVTARYLADKMWIAANVLVGMDEFWCATVSWPGATQCWENDTVLPAWTQDYALLGATRIIVRDGPAHTQEKEQSDSWLEDALTRLLHVPRRQ